MRGSLLQPHFRQSNSALQKKHQMILVLLLAALAAVSQATSNCLLGACYPPSGDLVLGRTEQLWASSTCGLLGSEVYCTPYQQRRMKCCPCDSRNPEGQLAHTVQDIVSTAGPERWWQSQKGVSPVTIQLDLKNLFQLDSLVLDFKGPRPQALVIERTLDNGRTWKPYVYMATDCPSAFPEVPTSTPLDLDDIYCYTLPPIGSDLYRDHQINFRPLEQYMYVPVPKGQKIEEVSGLTGLRVKLVQLGEVPEMPGRSLSRFFALKEMRVVGRCMCHGHANRCLPNTYLTYANNVQVHSRCDCQHNTAGLNCERCADLYNDLPWRAAEEDNTHACKRCECNNHAERCRFDRAVYEASGRRSGGVCIDCMHHTTGPKCDQCAPGYQPNPLSRMDRPDACIRCLCNAAGTVNGAQCDDASGSCRCKTNVEGPECDRCKQGFYNLSPSNPQGCTKCSCFPTGSVSQNCDAVTGQCPCRPNSAGLKCDTCSPGFWRPAGSERCVPCACDPTAAQSNVCDQQTGQCQCRSGFGGRTCAECANHMFGNPYRGCRPCDCDREGTFPEGCNKQTGACLCRPGVTGARCDTCRRDRCDSFPQCQTCPSCFFTLDAQRQNISLALQSLRPSGIPGPSPDFGPRIQVLESILNNIKNSISLPPAVAVKVDKAQVTMGQLQSEMDRVKNNLLPLEKTDLEPELDKLQDLLNSLNLEYKTKSDNLINRTSPTDTGPFSAIKNAYNESTDAARNVNTSKKVIQQSSDIRERTENKLNEVLPINTRDLSQLNNSLASNPDLSPLAKMVCGKVLAEPCTPLQCVEEELCAPEEVPPCEPGKPCEGALGLGDKAADDAQEVKDKLDVLSKKISDAAKKLQKTQESTNQVRQSAEELTNRMKEARDALEEDLKNSRDVVKELKDFLSDPASNLTHIQEVSDWVLKAKLPVTLKDLKTKLDELKSLASGLPDSTAVLNQAQPQLEAAKKLLQEAQEARDTAKGVKADVDGLVDGMRSMEESLSDLEDKLQDSMDLIDNLANNITKVQEQLTPAEKALDDASVLLKPLKPNLDELKNLLEEARQNTLDTQDKADQAEEKANTTAEDMKTLEKELETLKAKAAASKPGGDGADLGPRLTKLQQDAMSLANTTDHMFKALDGKADSIRQLQDEIIAKSSMLEGLDAKLGDLLAQLRKRAHQLRICQG